MPRVYYNPTDWYWIVNRDETRAFSSKRNQYVPADDEAYAEWAVRGDTRTTHIAGESELAAILAEQGLPTPNF